MGHHIKIEESFGFGRYLAFSEYSSYDDNELPQALRKIQKCRGATNSFILTFDEYMGSALSNGHSACRMSPIVVPAVTFSHPQYCKLSDQLISLVLVPSLLGFPILCILAQLQC